MKKSIYPLLLILISLCSCNSGETNVNLIPVKSGDKWGYVNRKGNIIINPQFEAVYNFQEGLALVKSSDGKFGYINEDGKYVINPIYKDASKFSEGVACVVMENGKPQYIDKTGKILFTVDKAESCCAFNEGMALVKIKGKWGYIDKTGKITVNAIYEDGEKFTDGLACVSKIDNKSKLKKWGYIDKSGAVKIEFQFESSKDISFCNPTFFTDGLAFVSSDGKKWGCIKEDGKYQINPQFDGDMFNIYCFKNGVSVIKQGETYGYIDKSGKYVINPQFKSAGNFSNIGYASVQNSDGKWGFIDKEGKYVINPQFDEIVYGFIGDIAFVKSSDKYGIVDKKGLYIANPQFDDVQLYDLDYSLSVSSDYIDNDELAAELFVNSSSNKYLGYGKGNTLDNLINEYPETSVENMKLFKVTIESPKIQVSDILKTSALIFGFSDKTYTETPVYKTESTYDYYSGRYYPRPVFDRFDKKINSTANISYVQLSCVLQNSDTGKVKRLAEAFKNQAQKVMKVKEIPHEGLINSNFKGLYLLSNDDILIWINYLHVQGEKKTNPSIAISVINRNYETSLEDLKNSILEKARNGDD